MHEPSEPPQFDHLVNNTNYEVPCYRLVIVSILMLLISFRTKNSHWHFVPRHRQSVKSSRSVNCVS
jgi:hypothetical protein